MRSATGKASSEADLIAALQRRISEQESRLTEQQTVLEAREARIRQLEQILRTFQRKTFTGTSEQASRAQLGLFNEAEEAVCEEVEPAEVEVPAHMLAPACKVHFSPI